MSLFGMKLVWARGFDFIVGQNAGLFDRLREKDARIRLLKSELARAIAEKADAARPVRRKLLSSIKRADAAAAYHRFIADHAHGRT